jgi:hypothetical protein
MVMPLAEMLLDILRDNDRVVCPHQRTAEVPLAGLLGISKVQINRR